MKRSNDFLVGMVVLAVILTLTGATLWVKQTDIGERRSRVVARFRDAAESPGSSESARATAASTVACQVRKSFALTSSPVTSRT